MNITAVGGVRRLWRRSPPEALLHLVYLGFVGLISLMAFQETTMSPLLPTEGQLRFVLVTELAAVVCKMAAERSWRWPELLLAALVTGVFPWTWLRIGERYLLHLALLILGARGVSFEKIVKVHLSVTAAALAVTVYRALSGQIPNLVYTRGGRPRISFGVIYPTDFCAHLFFLVCCWAWLRERRITWPELGGLLLLAWFCLRFCDARNTTLCLGLLAGGLAYVKLRRRLARGRAGEYRMNSAFSALLSLSAPLAALGMLLLSLLYREDRPWTVALDGLMSHRLSLGRMGFDRYDGFSWCGQPVYMQGAGGTTVPTEEYFWLDCSYVNILLRMGVLILFFALLTMVLGGLRQRRAGSWERLGLLTVAALHCAIEHHLMEIAYHPFLLMILAVSSPEPAAGRILPAFRPLSRRARPAGADGSPPREAEAPADGGQAPLP